MLLRAPAKQWYCNSYRETANCRICAGERLSKAQGTNKLILGLARHAWLIWCARHSKTHRLRWKWLKQPQLFWQWKLSNMTPAHNSISTMQAGSPSLATCMFIRIITQFLEKKNHTCSTFSQPHPTSSPRVRFTSQQPVISENSLRKVGCISRPWSCFWWFPAMEDLEGYRQAQAAEWHQVRGVLGCLPVMTCPNGRSIRVIGTNYSNDFFSH